MSPIATWHCSPKARLDRRAGQGHTLVHDYSGHAFTADLARGLASRQRRTTYVSCSSFSSPKGIVEASSSDPEHFRTVALGVGMPIDKDNLLARGCQETAYGFRLSRLIRSEKPACVISANAPLSVQCLLLDTCRSVGAQFIFWMQDIHSLAIARVLARGSCAAGIAAERLLGRFEAQLVARSNGVVVISDAFLDQLERWGVNTAHVHKIENWAPVSVPITRDNLWARLNFLPGRLRVIYSGTLARKHDPQMLIDVAQNVDADVYLFSTGSGAEAARVCAERLGLANFFVRPWVAPEVMPLMHGAADVLCAFIDADAGAFSVPSKVLSYLAAGRAVAAAIPANNLAAQTLEEADAGLLSAPGDGSALAANVRRLLLDRTLRESLGRQGRAYAERTFDLAGIVDRFEDIIERVIWFGPHRDA